MSNNQVLNLLDKVVDLIAASTDQPAKVSSNMSDLATSLYAAEFAARNKKPEENKEKPSILESHKTVCNAIAEGVSATINTMIGKKMAKHSMIVNIEHESYRILIRRISSKEMQAAQNFAAKKIRDGEGSK